MFSSWVLVAHAYNASYSGGGNQEACGSKASPDKKLDPISKISNTNKGWRSGSVAKGSA
jgi:hypothetical protein